MSEKEKMLSKKINKLTSEKTLLKDEINNLTSEKTTLKSEIDNKNKEIEELKAQIFNQQLQINQFSKLIFGAKRESKPKEENLVEGTQLTLFEVPEDIKEEVDKQTEEIVTNKKKNKKKHKAGIKRSALKDVETVVEEYKLEDEQLVCPECSSELKPIGKEVVREEIEIIPAKIVKKVYVRYSYKCVKCGTTDAKKDTPTIVKTKTPQSLLPHSFVSPSLATEVIYKKYYLGVPLYRQEKMWDDIGLELPRNIMANWCIKSSEYYLESLYRIMLKTIKKEAQLLHVDETTIQVNKEEGKKASSNSYMWVITTGELEEKQATIFTYSRNRSGEFAKNLLSGYQKNLITDGYSGYNAIEETTTHAECWAHARRYFYNSIPTVNKEMDTTAAGYKGLCLIDEMFHAEKEIEEEIIELKKDKEVWIKKKVELRQEKIKPVLEKFYEWVELTSEKYSMNKKLIEALTYVKNQKKQLSEFLNNGIIPLTNSRCERAIRPFAVHRKNWLFSDTVAGANANAVYYSFIETAKLNKLNIYKYINYLLKELPQLEGTQTEEEIQKYLPWSKELPNEIRNYEEEYLEMKLDQN